MDSRLTPAAIRTALLAARNPDGGWAYYPEHATRLEPTTWALLALARDAGTAVDFAPLLRWPRKDDWLVDGPKDAPVNFAFNALAAIACAGRAEAAAFVRTTATKVVGVKGIALQQNEVQRQNNALQAWSWIDGTFSWVEPTAWCTLLLKRTLALGVAGASERIETAERLIRDRVCHDGGWNYGGSNVYGQELYPYVPTTAIALLAMQDRRTDAAVAKSEAWLEANVGTEPTAVALSLSAIALGLYGRPRAAIDHLLPAAVEISRIRTNVLGLAMALYAVSTGGHGTDAFTL